MASFAPTRLGEPGQHLAGRCLLGLIAHLRSLGVSLAPVLAALGEPESALYAPDCRVAAHAQDAAFAAAERVTGDTNIGLHAGTAAHLRQFGMVGQLALACRSGRELLELYARYQALLGALTCTARRSREGATQVTFQASARAVSHHALEYTIVAQLTLARFLSGPEFAPREVSFAHSGPADSVEHRRVFGCPVRFGASDTCVTWPPHADTLALDGAPDEARAALEGALLDQLTALGANPANDGAEVARCQQYIAGHLASGAPSIEEAALALAVSVRTLQRRLDEHGISYRDLIDSTRRTAAQRMLSDRHLTLTEIALRLGFSDQSAFNRAFRRWFAITPNAMRARLLEDS